MAIERTKKNGGRGMDGSYRGLESTIIQNQFAMYGRSMVQLLAKGYSNAMM